MLLNIDYLILNFKGKFDYRKNPYDLPDDVKPFHLVLRQYGTKVFKCCYDLFYCDERVGVLMSEPRSNVIDSELVQLQFENYLFYQNALNELGRMVTDFVNYYDLKLHGVNRLDICCDNKENRLKYENLYTDLIKGEKLLKGREKNISAYMLTKNGKTQFNGFTVGKRSSARFLRIYNKTTALALEEGKKDYIKDWHESNGLSVSPGLDIWRFEYQLNNRFFADKKEQGEDITWQIFDYNKLLELFNYARTNHFEPVYNTGKTETNKEALFIFTDFSLLERTEWRYVSKIARKALTNSLTSVKRLAKGLFRQYYSNPNLAFLYPLQRSLKEHNLLDWFARKYPFYVHEFMDKERIRGQFHEPIFIRCFERLHNLDNNIPISHAEYY